MHFSTFWKINKAGKKVRRSTGKANIPNIRWLVLGLPDPRLAKLTPSIETIRSEVSSLSGRGLGQGVRSRATGQYIQGTESGRNSRNRVRTTQQ